MKYYKYWKKENFTIKIDNQDEVITVLAGSNISVEDAYNEAREHSQDIEQRIAAGEGKESYQSAIREHVSDILDDENILTVCRYGAKVLNTTQYTILDLDDYPASFFDRFKAISKLPRKARIIAKFEQNIKKYPQLGSDFRIYETAKGIRVIGKNYIAPSTKGYVKLMRTLGVDQIYIGLSKKQNCYRARLTPKPYRMKHKAIKIRSPLDCETIQYKDWKSSYETAAERYSVVKLVKTLGTDFEKDSVIKLHDSVCNLQANKRLA
ncbi:hypothetical protein N474_22910 [Pseudoalteromonas luteoviolacea CPMOR-2]|uniref:Uncharacterized protein n=1 Tax=Pseudoalteromonas luteoviolacea DSM 6061 TaxID=1365250 RepID=A0A166YQQ7_9GAMM|nr:hypothetical protein [Pseudoalteromonas luteoviolacea]KZN43274.1 hypothetical protein N475_09225 [Pseudoalteromonas luteoviolacea DSM 6061]KZN52689.1 hypothetical protein N474_22910 [Pseudoalteromonas luteoviolacea CPMOR-2]MBE0385459.1 hypothetical protein [Pseudoalteromonas luteoviolacea DSM 6061]